MLNSLIQLALRTLSEPREVAKELAALDLNRQMLWLALALAVVLNTIVYQLSLVLTPPPSELPVLFTSPVMFAVFIGAGLIFSIYAITYAGRILGGSARLETIMTLLIWLQFLRLAVQLAAFVLVPVLPLLAGILVMAASLYGIWLLLNFVDVAHGLGSLFTSFGVLVLSALAMMVGLAILLSLFGIQNMGLTPYV